MDFVIAGILLGALAVAIGETIRIMGPRRSPAERRSLRRTADPTDTSKAWLRTCQSLGMLITTAGAALLLVTMVLTLANASDRLGWMTVGVIAAIGIPGCLLGSWMILNRYRSGGFDPIWIDATQARIHADADDLGLYDDEPLWNPPTAPAPAATVAPAVASPPVEPEPVKVPEPGPVIAVESIPFTDGTDPLVAVEAIVPTPPPSPATGNPWPNEPAAVVGETAPEPAPLWPDPVRQPAREPAPRQSALPPVQPDRSPPPSLAAEPVRRPTLPDFAAPNFDLPLIDLDDELPAWNAPAATAPVGRSRPTPVQVVSAEVELEIPDVDEPGGFQSSLLADIAPIADSAAPTAEGKFASRLLNELTADDRPAAAPRADIVLDVRPNNERNR